MLIWEIDQIGAQANNSLERTGDAAAEAKR